MFTNCNLVTSQILDILNYSVLLHRCCCFINKIILHNSSVFLNFSSVFLQFIEPQIEEIRKPKTTTLSESLWRKDGVLKVLHHHASPPFQDTTSQSYSRIHIFMYCVILVSKVQRLSMVQPEIRPESVLRPVILFPIYPLR